MFACLTKCDRLALVPSFGEKVQGGAVVVVAVVVVIIVVVSFRFVYKHYFYCQLKGSFRFLFVCFVSFIVLFFQQKVFTIQQRQHG